MGNLLFLLLFRSRPEQDSERFNFALSADGFRAYYTTSVFRFQSVVGYLGPECLIPAFHGALQPREQI